MKRLQKSRAPSTTRPSALITSNAMPKAATQPGVANCNSAVPSAQVSTGERGPRPSCAPSVLALLSTPLFDQRGKRPALVLARRSSRQRRVLRRVGVHALVSGGLLLSGLLSGGPAGGRVVVGGGGGEGPRQIPATALYGSFVGAALATGLERSVRTRLLELPRLG